MYIYTDTSHIFLKKGEGIIIRFYKWFKKQWIMFLAYYFISIFILITVMNVITIKSNLSKSDIYSPNAVEIYVLNTKSKTKLEKFIEEIIIEDGDLLTINLPSDIDKSYSVCGVKVGQNYNFNISLVNGEKISIQELNKANNLAIVSENIKEEIYNDEDGSYINYLGNIYRVIGISKSDNTASKNAELYINLNTIYGNEKISQSALDYNYIYDSGIGTKNYIEKLKNRLLNEEKIGIQYNMILKDIDLLMYSIKINKTFIICLVLLILVVMLTVLNILTYWMECEKKELSIRRLLGATKFQVALRIVKKYLVTTVTAMMLAVLSFEILKYFNMLEIFYIKQSKLINDLVSVIVLFSILIITALIPISFIIGIIFKLSINSAVRGGKNEL